MCHFHLKNYFVSNKVYKSILQMKYMRNVSNYLRIKPRKISLLLRIIFQSSCNLSNYAKRVKIVLFCVHLGEKN